MAKLAVFLGVEVWITVDWIALQHYYSSVLRMDKQIRFCSHRPRPPSPSSLQSPTEADTKCATVSSAIVTWDKL